MEHFFKKKIIRLFLGIFLAVLLFSLGVLSDYLFNYLKSAAFSPDATPLEGADISVCTGVVTVYNCINPLTPTISWSTSGNDQVAYAVQIDDDGALACATDFPSPEVDYQEYSSAKTFTVPDGLLSYSTTYYWQVAAQDSSGSWSGWAKSETSFTTPLHQWPLVDFSWDPDSPRAEAEVQFIDGSSVYGGATKQEWSWTFEDGTPATSSDQNPIVFFTSEGEKQVTLQVTDSDGYVCSESKTVTVGASLIKFEEIIPR